MVPAALRHIDEAVRAFTLNYGDVTLHLAKAREAAPGCVMADLLQAWLLVLSNDQAQVARARELVSGISSDGLSDREREHLAALTLASQGRWPSAVAVLDRHLMSDPHDLTGHQCALRLDGYLGRFHRAAARSARALPFWSRDEPGYGIMLSFYGFGLEELGDYARAEDVSREAAELEPYGYWPHHAVSHVLEMTGRPQEGLAWMEERLPYCRIRSATTGFISGGTRRSTTSNSASSRKRWRFTTAKSSGRCGRSARSCAMRRRFCGGSRRLAARQETAGATSSRSGSSS